jgi:hypothetical protein
MKRTIMVAGCLLYLLAPVFSQEQKLDIPPADSMAPVKLKSEPRFYVNIHTGYSLALGSTFKFYPDDISSIAVETADGHQVSKKMSYKVPSKGLGEGIRVGGGISYILNDFINVGLDADYFRSTISKVKDSTVHETFSSGNISGRTFNDHYTISYDAILLTFSPNITFKAVSRPKWFLYNKIGAVITFRPNSIEHDEHITTSKTIWQGFAKDSSGYSNTRYEWGIRNPSIGFSGAIGAQVKLTEKIRVFSELQFSHVVFVIRKRTTTNYNIDGKEMVNTLTVNEKEIDFEKDFKTDDFTPDPNKPNKAVTQRIPITYVGLQVGLVYRF